MSHQFPAAMHGAMLQRFATLYRDGSHVEAPADVLQCAKENTQLWFQRIPVQVSWVTNDPYPNFMQMARDIRAGHFKVTCNGFVSRIWGTHYQRFRALHDYWGHFVAGNPFGVEGELRAYGSHCAQFPRECWPLIFNELVLANSHKDYFGHPGEDKLVIPPTAWSV